MRPPDLPPERNLYAGQEATVKTGHETTDWFTIGKGVHQRYILSPCLFNFYVDYIMWNAGLDEGQAGIEIAGRNINNLTCADDTTPMAESKEELKSLLMKVKQESEEASLKQHSKNEDHDIQPHYFMANRWGKWEQWQILLSWAPKSLLMVTAAMKLKVACFLEEKPWQT